MKGKKYALLVIASFGVPGVYGIRMAANAETNFKDVLNQVISSEPKRISSQAEAMFSDVVGRLKKRLTQDDAAVFCCGEQPKLKEQITKYLTTDTTRKKKVLRIGIAAAGTIPIIGQIIEL